MAAQMPPQSRPYHNGLLPNGGPPSGPVPGAAPLLPNQGRVIQQGSTRILCIADVRGDLKHINDLAKDARADYVLHTGDFGFYDNRSLDRVAEKTLRHVTQYSPLLTKDIKDQVSAVPSNQSIKDRIPREQLLLSQLPQFLNKSLNFEVPVYTVWGACEDVAVLERFRSGEYKVNNLHVIDEKTSRLLDVGGVKLRLLGLGGAIVYHKLFDNGEGKTTIAGGQGTMWTTVMQIGEVVDTAQRVYDPSETRVLITHASPARDGLLNQLAVSLKVDFSISAGLHFRYGSSYNEFSVNPSLDTYRGKLGTSKDQFKDVWDTVKSEVEPLVADNDEQKKLLRNALDIVDKMPDRTTGNPFGGNQGAGTGQVDEAAFKNMWNFNLADAAYGWLVLDIDGGRIGTELKAQGFNFAHRGQRQMQPGPSNAAPYAGPSTLQPNGSGVAGQAPPPQPRISPAPTGPAATQTPLQSRGRPVQQTPAEKQPQLSVPQSQQQAAPPKPVPAPASQSSASAASFPNQNARPAAPSAPQSNSTNADGTTEKADGKPNGTADDSTPSKDTPPPIEKKPSTAIFMSFINSEEEAKTTIPEAERSKIQRVENRGRNWIVHFNSPEDMQSSLDAAKQELKNRPGNGPNRPSVRVYEDRPRTSGWGGRGGAPSGYRSGGGGGGASDSDTNRRGGGANRGAYRRGGPRNRGGRGGGPGRVGGEGGSSPAPAPASAGGGNTS